MRSILTAPGERRRYSIAAIAALAAFLIASIDLIGPEDAYRFGDDSFYYLIVAKNISGRLTSEFFEGVLTNGYHPLWVALCALYGIFVDLTPFSVRILENCLVSGIVLLVVVNLKQHSPILVTAIMLLLLYSLNKFANNGMETTLLSLTLTALFVLLYLRDREIRGTTFYLTIAIAAMAIGSRIDSVLFVIPLLVLSRNITTKRKFLGITALAIIGASYAAFNLYYFDTVLPVSGQVKSLGGIQFNERYFDQIGCDFNAFRCAIGILLLHPWRSPVYLTAAALSLVAVNAVGPNSFRLDSVVSRFLLAVGVGGVLFVSKLLFFSSWIVWSWYGYPAFLFVLSGILFLDRHRIPTLVLKPFSVAAVIGFSWHFGGELLAKPETNGFPALSQKFVDEHRDELSDVEIAMGDRAGSFSYHLGKGVFQLEGLVGNKEYLRQLSSPQEITHYLCEIGIEVVVDFERPMESYGLHRLSLLRPRLTQYEGAYLDLLESNQIVAYQDPEVFSSREEPDTVIYAWRLDCGP